MTSINLGKKTAARLLSISTALLLYSQGALAAQAVADPQDQVRAFITPSTHIASGADDSAPVVLRSGDHADPQDTVRQFILATPHYTPLLSAIAARADGVGYIDRQELVRRTILGLGG
jgi:hypothetical protein